jgi:hypothetical protein
LQAQWPQAAPQACADIARDSGLPLSKLDWIRALCAAGDKLGALGIAATFSDRSAETLAMSGG